MARAIRSRQDNSLLITSISLAVMLVRVALLCSEYQDKESHKGFPG
jgi:hypothetical protein